MFDISIYQYIRSMKNENINDNSNAIEFICKLRARNSFSRRIACTYQRQYQLDASTIQLSAMATKCKHQFHSSRLIHKLGKRYRFIHTPHHITLPFITIGMKSILTDQHQRNLYLKSKCNAVLNRFIELFMRIV